MVVRKGSKASLEKKKRRRSERARQREMGRDRGRGVVCVGSVEDNTRVFIIVFGFRLFFSVLV